MRSTNIKQPHEGNIKDIGDSYSVKHMKHYEYNQFLKYLFQKLFYRVQRFHH